MDGATIKRASIGSAQIGSASINSAHIQSGSITNAHLSNVTITDSMLRNVTIDGAKIKNATVDTVQIKNQAVTSLYTASGSGTSYTGGLSGLGNMATVGETVLTIPSPPYGSTGVAFISAKVTIAYCQVRISFYAQGGRLKTFSLQTNQLTYSQLLTATIPLTHLSGSASVSMKWATDSVLGITNPSYAYRYCDWWDVAVIINKR